MFGEAHIGYMDICMHTHVKKTVEKKGKNCRKFHIYFPLEGFEEEWSLTRSCFSVFRNWLRKQWIKKEVRLSWHLN